LVWSLSGWAQTNTSTGPKKLSQVNGFNHFLSLARAKTFTPEDETQFLEVKSNIAQGLEMLMSQVEGGGAPAREEIHALLTNAPSIRYMSELADNSLRGLENQWHKIFLG
jgi:hypothetical protein